MAFNETIEQYTTDTSGHADEFNARQEKLLENDLHLQELAEQLEMSVDELENVLYDDIDLIRENQLNLRLQLDLENIAEPDETGYWWDVLANEDKINTLTNTEISNNQLSLMTGELTGETVWNTYDIDFITDRIRYFQDRSISDRVAVTETANEGDDSISIQLAEVTITEVE